MRKGVSPLIAAVLLIAFTMAVAAILTAWISSFTTGQKEKIAELEEKVQCAYADMRADPNFARYNATAGTFSVWVENTGSETVNIKYFIVEYPDGRVTRKMELQNADAVTLSKREGKSFGPMNLANYTTDSSRSGITVSVSVVPQKISLLAAGCDGVRTSVFKPAGGWTSD